MIRFLRFALGSALAALTAPSLAQDGSDKAQARRIFAKIIEFRTSQGQGQVPPMVSYLEGVLREGGVPPGNIVKLPKDETVAMLVRVPGTDRSSKPILFSAHMDVVDARPEDWKRDPYKLIEENGYLYGRGTLDDKAMAATLVDTLIRFQRSGYKPKRTFKIALTCGEETNGAFNGAQWLAANRRDLIDAEFALNEGGGGTSDGRKRTI